MDTMTYPNQRVLKYQYGTTGGVDDTLNRIASLYDYSTSGPELAGYKYLGLGQIINVHIALSGQGNAGLDNNLASQDGSGRKGASHQI